MHPRATKSAIRTGCMLAIILFATGACATAPFPSSPEVTFALLSVRDLGTYGQTFASNPFLAPSGFVHGAPDEFVAVGLKLALPDAGTVSLDGSVRTPDGREVARFYSLPEVQKYWSDWGDQSDLNSRSRLDTLNRWYPSASQFQAGKGRSEYVVILVGKNPLPRPATVTLTVTLNGGPQEFTFPLPDKK